MPTVEQIIEMNLIPGDRKKVRVRFTNASLINASGRVGEATDEERGFFGMAKPEVVKLALRIKTEEDKVNLIKAAQILAGSMLGIKTDVQSVREAYKRRNRSSRQLVSS